MVANFKITFASVPVMAKWFALAILKNFNLRTLSLYNTYFNICTSMSFGSYKISLATRSMDLISFTTWYLYYTKDSALVIWLFQVLYHGRPCALLFLLVCPLDLCYGVVHCSTMWYRISYPFLKSNRTQNTGKIAGISLVTLSSTLITQVCAAIRECSVATEVTVTFLVFSFPSFSRKHHNMVKTENFSCPIGTLYFVLFLIGVILATTNVNENSNFFTV